MNKRTHAPKNESKELSLDDLENVTGGVWSPEIGSMSTSKSIGGKGCIPSPKGTKG